MDVGVVLGQCHCLAAAIRVNADGHHLVNAVGKGAGQYLVKFDTNGNGNNWDSLGPWTPSMGDFITDATGHATWGYTARTGTYTPGTYTWSVFINLASVYPPRSILVSENVVFTIPSR